MGKEITPIFQVLIKDGKLTHKTDIQEFESYIQNLQDGEYSLKVYKRSKIRTTSQHRLYWLYLNVLEKEGMGEAEYLNEYFKKTHLQPLLIEVMGKEMEIQNSTRNLTTKEFSELISKIYLETGVPIPTLDRWDFN